MYLTTDSSKTKIDVQRIFSYKTSEGTVDVTPAQILASIFRTIVEYTFHREYSKLKAQAAESARDKRKKATRESEAEPGEATEAAVVDESQAAQEREAARLQQAQQLQQRIDAAAAEHARQKKGDPTSEGASAAQAAIARNGKARMSSAAPGGARKESPSQPSQPSQTRYPWIHGHMSHTSCTHERRPMLFKSGPTRLVGLPPMHKRVEMGRLQPCQPPIATKGEIFLCLAGRPACFLFVT